MGEIQELSFADLKRVTCELLDEVFRRAEQAVPEAIQIVTPGIPPEVGQLPPAPNPAGVASGMRIGELPVIDKFKLGGASLARLTQLYEPLAAVVHLAIRITDTDFTVFETIRTVKKQKEYVRKGVSKTMKSKHLPQPPDHKSHAVDLVPWIDGRAQWLWEPIYRVTFAMDCAASYLGVADKIRWGGAWDRVLSDFGGSPAAYKQECRLYAERLGRKPFLDGPHFEWVG